MRRSVAHRPKLNVISIQNNYCTVVTVRFRSDYYLE
jgi:hypothetical protein